MKKLLLFAVVLGAVSFTSCKKDYTCTLNAFGSETVVEYNNISKDDASTLESACKAGGGTWATK